MSAVNDPDFKFKDLEKLIDHTQEAVQSIREFLLNNEDAVPSVDKLPKRDTIEDKVTVLKKLSEMDPKDYEDHYYSAESLGQ